MSSFPIVIIVIATTLGVVALRYQLHRRQTLNFRDAMLSALDQAASGGVAIVALADYLRLRVPAKYSRKYAIAHRSVDCVLIISCLSIKGFKTDYLVIEVSQIPGEHKWVWREFWTSGELPPIQGH